MTTSRRELSCKTPDGVYLAGTLQTPGPGVWPAALILNGSGPLDRDSAMKGQALGFADAMANALAAVGIASLRFDKRGVGSSSGDYLSTGFHTETADAATAFATFAAAPEVDQNRIALIGHSIGALIAIRLAAADPNLGPVVMLAGPARNGNDVLTWQGDRIASTLPGPGWLLPKLFRLIQNRNLERVRASSAATIRVLSKRQPARWMREYMAHNPEAELRKVGCPVLAITGRKDLQVDHHDVARIESLVCGDFTGRTPDNLTHVLRLEEGPAGILSYSSQLKRPVDQALLQSVSAWIADRSVHRDANEPR